MASFSTPRIPEGVIAQPLEPQFSSSQAQQPLEAETSAIAWLTSPAHRVIDRTTTLLIRLASELGFSPAARPRLRVEAPKSPKEDTDPWAELRVIPGGRPE